PCSCAPPLHAALPISIADFDEAIRLDPRLHEAYTNRGLARYQLGRYAAANADYEQAIRLQPTGFYAHNNLAWVLATCPDQAHREDRKSTRLNSSHEWI